MKILIVGQISSARHPLDVGPNTRIHQLDLLQRLVAKFMKTTGNHMGWGKHIANRVKKA